MARPLYGQGQPNACRELDGHKGLWYDRFFNGYPAHWQPDRDKESKEAWAKAKTDWVNTAAGKAGDRKQCEAAGQRISTLCSALCGKSRVYAATWHLATGLGNPHPVENGFLWHPTLGTPYIAGSAVKGLVRAWVEAWQGFDDERVRLDTLYRWFGSEDKDPVERKERRAAGFNPPSQGQDLDTEAGGFIFFDALPVEPVTLKADVTTPHMGDWYMEGGKIDSPNQAKRIPADWHDPVPVCFLVADKPKFQFAIAPRSRAFIQEIDDVMDALGQALEWLGAGAKTAVGYGVMARDEKGENDIAKRINDAAEAARRGAERRASLAKMDTFERSIQELLDARSDKNQSEISFLLSAIKNGLWQGQEKEPVVRLLKAKMENEKKWKPVSNARRPEKDTDHQNTLLVSRWLGVNE